MGFFAEKSILGANLAKGRRRRTVSLRCVAFAFATGATLMAAEGKTEFF